MNRTLIIVVLVVAVAATTLYILTPRTSKTQFSNEFPDYFPGDMIAEPYTVNLEVLPDAPLPDEKHRILASYASYWDIARNEESFKKYFEANGFDTQKGDAGAQSFIGARKDKATATVTFWKRSPVQISIVYTVSK